MSNADDAALLTKFGRFYDGVISEVQVGYAPAVSASVFVSVIDVALGGVWVRLRLDFEGVGEYAIRDPSRFAINVLRDGLYIARFEGMVFLDFAPRVVDPVTVEDYRNSFLYIACHSYRWEVLP